MSLGGNMKKIAAFIISFVLLILLLSCRGYNNLMFEPLSNIENYVEVNGVLQDIYYWDDNSKVLWEESSESFFDNDSSVYFSLQFDEENYTTFCGCSEMTEDFEYSTNYIVLEIIPSNISIMYDNLFFESISYGDRITVKTSNFIYMDTNFFQIIGLINNGLEYLESETGLRNYIDYMNENSAIF